MLPKIDSPTFSVELPISKKKILFRPFLVKEQKILLMISETDDKEFLYENIKNLIKSCCVTQIDLEEISTVDFEYLFLHLRARSVGEVVNTKYRCENRTEEGVCSNLMDVSYDILETKVDTSKYFDEIKLSPTVGIKLKYPNYLSVQSILQEKSKTEAVFEVIKNCIDYIYDENNFYYPKETSDSELNEFLESLSVDKFEELQKYFRNLPTLEQNLEFKCDKCGYDHKITIRGINNFFD
jgi:hypothetical protein